jgi:hypothetical protein
MTYEELAESTAKEIADVARALMDGVDFTDLKEVMEAGLSAGAALKTLATAREAGAEGVPTDAEFAAHVSTRLSEHVVNLLVPMPAGEVPGA